MINTEIREATIEDARYIGANLRQGDYAEFIAYGENVSPAILVIESYQHSNFVRVATLDGIPAIMYGVADAEDDNSGLIWMVSTDDILKVSLEFIRSCTDEVVAMQSHYQRLCNFIHKDNALSKRWLKWLGFTIDETESSGDFQYFSKEITSCVE